MQNYLLIITSGIALYLLLLYTPSYNPFNLSMSSITPEIHTCFEPVTSTWQYVVADPATRQAVIIDSVLDFDPVKNCISTESADKLLDLVTSNHYLIGRILETHAHADHLTASAYLQQRLVKMGQPRPDICIGRRIRQVQDHFAKIYGINTAELQNLFDKLLDDNEEFFIGRTPAKVLHLPGHTPDHIGYKIGDNVFTGDSIFNPDVGSARADFPGGSSTDLFHSTRTLLSLPPHYRLYTGHDYPPETRSASTTGEKHRPFTTVAEQNEQNKHVKAGAKEADFVKWRSERDGTLGEPRLLHRALQFNIRAGRLPPATGDGGERCLHLPIKLSESAASVMND
jgi:glyoxylase-like metal-dependent hydrolase (beta-lactamase superfamily II)